MTSHTRMPIDGIVRAPGEARSFARATASVSRRARRLAITACRIGCPQQSRRDRDVCRRRLARGRDFRDAVRVICQSALAPGAAGPVGLPLMTTALYMPAKAAAALFALPVIALACPRRSDGRRAARLLIAPRDGAAGG
jgi:hypothetical protein